MQKNRWSRKFDWVTNDSGVTYFQKEHTIEYDEDKFIAVGDIYFKLNKYLTGVTFSYINNLYDIYKTDLLTGDGESIVNMYNEYDLIDDVLRNLHIVDVASNSNINIKSQCVSIDGVRLKPTHLVLLKNQDLLSENDIYIVNNNNFLENFNLLSSREKSYKFSCSVKLGTSADKQFFLETTKTTTSEYFPIYYETKTFIEGQSYLLKHLVNYNLYNTVVEDYSGTTTSKIIFTDYETARNQLDGNVGFYSNFEISLIKNDIPTHFFTINYHNESYSIRYGSVSDITYSGNTNTIINDNNGTKVYYDDSFDVVTGDYLEINMSSSPPSGYTFLTEETYDECSGSGTTTVIISESTTGITITNLNLKTYIKDVNSIEKYFYLEEVIPTRILNDLKNSDYELTNLSVAYDWDDALNKFVDNPYSEFYDIKYTDNLGIFYDLIVSAKESEYNKYFDYDGLTFNLTDNYDYRKFETDNQYINYKLYDRLNQIDDSVFNTGFTFYNEYSLNSILSYRYTDSDTIRVFTDVDNLTDIFKPYTYVYASNSSGGTELTWVHSVNDYEIVIERPRNWTQYPIQRQEPPITSITNIDGLSNISNILYELYINDEYDGGWYSKRNADEIKKSTGVYSELLINSSDITDKITGIIYDDKNEYVFKLYDIVDDQNLYYSPIELIFVGSDKITRLPVPFTYSGVTTTTTTVRRTPIIPGVIPTTTTTTTTVIVTPTTTTTTTTVIVTPTTTTTTTTILDCAIVGEVNCNYVLSCDMVGFVECDFFTTTTTTTTPVTTTTTTTHEILPCDLYGIVECDFFTTTTTTTTHEILPCDLYGIVECDFFTTTTTTTTSPATTTSTTTKYFGDCVADVYFGVSTKNIVSVNDVLTTFEHIEGNIGSETGRKYLFSQGYYYKYWLIPDYPNSGYRVVDNINSTDGNVNLVYNNFYRFYQESPNPEGQQSVNYGKMAINGIEYRIYRSITKSTLQTECFVYSIE